MKGEARSSLEVFPCSFLEYFSRPARGSLVPRAKLVERFAQFARGQWADLVEESIRKAAVRKRRRQDDVDLREGSHGRGWPILENCLLHGKFWRGAAVAPGMSRTMRELTNPEKRLLMKNLPQST